MVRIGISGWTYAGWRGKFYPPDLKQREELAFASNVFNSIEINGTHYALQKPETFASWRKQTPKGFVFSVKGSRYITHLRRLKNVEKPLANFMASGVLALKEKLGPFLWQLPPKCRFDPDRIEAFFRLLPRSGEEAVGLARKREPQMKGRCYLRHQDVGPIRHCMEVRHESFMVPKFFALLRKYKVAFVFADTAGKWPYAEDLTSDFVYIRLHGDEVLYVSGYGGEILKQWASKIRRWEAGSQIREAKLVTPRSKSVRGRKEIFVYFDNDAKVKAPGDARQLAALM